METKFVKPKITENDGMVLYCYPHNYYSQKVLIAMYEKNLHFEIYSIDVGKGEQFSEWFLEISPRGDIPVLQDGLFIIPETTKILHYLEHRYKDSDDSKHDSDMNSNLKVSQTCKKLEFFKRSLDRMPVGALSIGCFLHDQYCTKIKQPYIGPVRDALLATDLQLVNDLKEMAYQRPHLQDFFLRKANKLQHRRKVLHDVDTFVKILNQVDCFLEKVEEELNESNNSWLCGANFTLLDVRLGIFLQRLYILGLEDYFWSKNKKPLVESYLRKFLERESVKKSIPSAISTMRAIWGSIPYTYKYAVFAIGVSSVALAGSVMLK